MEEDGGSNEREEEGGEGGGGRNKVREEVREWVSWFGSDRYLIIKVLFAEIYVQMLFCDQMFVQHSEFNSG